MALLGYFVDTSNRQHRTVTETIQGRDCNVHSEMT